MSPKKILSALVAASCLLAFFPARGGVVITGTRAIYPEGAREIGVRLTNPDNDPVMIQAWIDDGRLTVTPDAMEVPFVLMPSMARIDAKKGQTLRIMHTGESMPKDRESLYWLNVLEIPKKVQEVEGKNYMKVAFQTRIKLFYRPAALEKIEIAKPLSWALVPAEKGGGKVLSVSNSSPSYQSFANISVIAGGKKIVFSPITLAPFEKMNLVPADGTSSLAGASEVAYGLVNDYGGLVSETATLQ